MGLDKFTRGAGKVGLALETLGYVLGAGKALVAAIRNRRSNQNAQHTDDGRQNDDTRENPGA